MSKGITVLSLFDGMSCGQIALKELGISVRQAYRRLRNIEVSAENENFDYEAETPKGEWV